MGVPFEEQTQLLDLRKCPHTYLPGQPRIFLTHDPHRLVAYLEKDLCTNELDSISAYLWLMSTKSFSNISPLHHQRVKGRQIILTEDPRLHLLWIDDKIFVKPLPPYLLSFDFWRDEILPDETLKGHHFGGDWRKREELTGAALGLLRSYWFLIQYSSDLEIAVEHRLLPAGTSWEAYCAFTSHAAHIVDADVAPRYQYGEIRLARLNMWSKVLLCRWNYQTVNWHYRQYFQRFYAPLLFVFGFFSVTLSALQVEMAVEAVLAQNGSVSAVWPQFWMFSRSFCIVSLAMVGLPSVGILVMLIGKPLMELRYALTH